MKSNLRTLLISVAWSWFLLGCVAGLVEYWRPNFVDYLIPLWVIWSVALLTASGAFFLSKK